MSSLNRVTRSLLINKLIYTTLYLQRFKPYLKGFRFTSEKKQDLTRKSIEK